MDYRKIFDTIPEEFDKWRPRYCDELFIDLIKHSSLSADKSALEIGPGTGQATEPIIKTGCSYQAIELGENFAEFMTNKFQSYDNFTLIHADFELYDFGQNKFDLVYSAAAFQWIKEDIGYPKVYDMLKSGGTFATFGVASGSRIPALDDKMQEIYADAELWKTEFDYANYIKARNSADELDTIGKLKKYGFVDAECRQYSNTREFNCEDYISYIQTHSTHIGLKEPHKSRFYSAVRDVITGFGGNVTLNDEIILNIARKP
jgi:SAM-dependent methyltransferase